MFHEIISNQSKWQSNANYSNPIKVARLRKHSLQVAPESVYPSNSRRGSYRFLRASYTAGSMAGLGFSMVILGICIGIFLGFLLWKRRLGVIPYYLNPWQRPAEEAAMMPQSSTSTDIGLLHAHQYPTSQSLVSDLPTFDSTNEQLTAPILVPNLSPTRRYWNKTWFDTEVDLMINLELISRSGIRTFDIFFL